MNPTSPNKTAVLLSLILPALALGAAAHAAVPTVGFQQSADPVPAPPEASWWSTAAPQLLSAPMTDLGSDSFDAGASAGSSRWYVLSGNPKKTTRIPGRVSVTRTFADAPSKYQLSFDCELTQETMELYYKAHYQRVANGWIFSHYEASSAVLDSKLVKYKMGGNVKVDMAGRKLKAGDREVIGFAYDGEKLVVDQSASVFDYDVDVTFANCLNCPFEAKLVAKARK